MAISNKHGAMVVATGNKSEMAAGYATLYGDMAGGLRRAQGRDSRRSSTPVRRGATGWGAITPERVSTRRRPPSSALPESDQDSDSCRPTMTSMRSSRLCVERDLGGATRSSSGLRPRRRSGWCAWSVATSTSAGRPPGVKITVKAFGKDRRLPITNRHKPSSP